MSVNKLFGCYQCDQKRQRDKDTFILIKGNITLFLFTAKKKKTERDIYSLNFET